VVSRRAEDEVRWIGGSAPDTVGSAPDTVGSAPDAVGSAPGPGGWTRAPGWGGLSWSWEMDLGALLSAVCGPPPWQRGPVECGAGGQGGGMPGAGGGAADRVHADGVGSARSAGDAATGVPGGLDAVPEVEAEYLEALAAGPAAEMPAGVVAGRVAELLPPGPDLAGWLALAPVADMEDGALAGVAAGFRRLASWAAAGELAAVAELVSRSARADADAHVDGDGRPDRVTADAAGQIALALALSADGAQAWADLAITLAWRLPQTREALATGRIDLPRARTIARVTDRLGEAAARQVEQAVLGRAGQQSLGQLHAALRRAVVKADPAGAERRREDAEQNARVALYPEDEGTATLAGYALPGVHAAAAMSRITALAKAMKAAGAAGRIDQVRARVFLGLLLGTLPYIPPAPGAPAGPPPGEDPGGAEDDPGGAGPGGPARGGGDGGDRFTGPTGPWPDVPTSRKPAPPWPLGGVWPAPGGGLLDMTVPWATLAGASAAPGRLTRLGTITPSQAMGLAGLAARDPTSRWRVIVTTAGGRAIAVAAIPRPAARTGHGPPGARHGPAVASGQGPPRSSGPVGRVTVTISASALRHPLGTDRAQDPVLAALLDRARTAAGRAVARAAAGRAVAGAAGQAVTGRAGECAHPMASRSYRPPPRIRELVAARDGTCRFATCRQPASRCDLDHTIPWHRGGPTCACNLGGECRRHHQLKQHPRWRLAQTAQGTFYWTTPVGRTYIVRPDPHIL